MKMEDPTVILKSLKDLDSFINRDKDMSSFRRQSLSQSQRTAAYSPRLKLNFDESANSDNSSLIDSFTQHNETYLQRHRESIAGFDITKKIREKDGELNQAKTTISILESKLENLHSSSKKRKVDFDSELEMTRKSNFREKELIDDLQHKLKQLQMSEKETKENALKVKKTLEEKCSQLEKKVLFFQTEVHTENEKYREEAFQWKTQFQNSEKELEEKRSSLHILDLSYKELEERAKSVHGKYLRSEQSNLQSESLMSQLKKEQLKNKELEMNIQNLEKHEKNFGLFEDSIRRIPFLEKEIAKLKDENSTLILMGINVTLVEEKLSGVVNENRSLGIRCKELEMENSTLSSMLEASEKYEEAVKREFNLTDLPPVAEFVELIQKLKQTADQDSAALNNLKESVQTHKNHSSSINDKIQTLELDLKTSKQENENLSSHLKRMQRKLVLVSKERDSLKEIMHTYESESTINIRAVEQQKISRLESILEDYKSELKNYEGQSANKGLIGEPSKSSPGDGERVKELQEMLSKLVSEKEMLELKLEQQILKGSFDPSKNKVIHFVDNPLDRANQEERTKYDTLEKENQGLKKRIELMEEGDSHDLTQKVGAKLDNEGVNSKQVQELKEKTKNQETQINRMLEAFKKKSSEMREVVYRLTGYRVDLRRDNNYRLINTYADSPDDYLLFEEDKNFELQLMETEFSAGLGSLVETYLLKGSSFPAFLSAVTLELYNRQTMMQSPAEEEEGVSSDEEPEDYEEEEDEPMDDEEVHDDDEEQEPEFEEDEEDADEEDDHPPPSQEEDDDDLICLD